MLSSLSVSKKKWPLLIDGLSNLSVQFMLTTVELAIAKSVLKNKFSTTIKFCSCVSWNLKLYQISQLVVWRQC